MRMIFTYLNGQTYTARSPKDKVWSWKYKDGSHIFKYWVTGDKTKPVIKVNLTEVSKIKIFPTNSQHSYTLNIKNNRVYSDTFVHNTVFQKVVSNVQSKD